MMNGSIDLLLDYQIKARHFPGALIHVERAGRILARQAAGVLGEGIDAPMHDGAIFRLASLTKPVVTVAALIQVDAGLLALDAPVGDYLPVLNDLRMKSGARPDRAPTVRDLMRHTSGLEYGRTIQDPAVRELVLQSTFLEQLPRVDSKDFLGALAALPLVAQPGTTFHYGYSTDVLGLIIEKVDGVPLWKSLKTRILGPLGMNETGFEVPESQQARLASPCLSDAAWAAYVSCYGIRKEGQPWMESGGAGLVSTLDDTACFARMLANGGCIRGERLLSENLFDELRRNQLSEGVAGPVAFTGPGFGFGLGLAVRLDWGAAAVPSPAGELAWSGISGAAMFVHPGERSFALSFSCNMTTRMMARMEFRRAAALLSESVQSAA
jgi:CubicO group peptidase (beta-lactamase class C family)